MKFALFHRPVQAFTFCALMLPASSSMAQDAAAAFADGDYATAQQLWTEDASAGSTDAMLGLALLADAGFLGEPDPDAAFGWYLQAAELGEPEAQFNVALGYDKGGFSGRLSARSSWCSCPKCSRGLPNTGF